MSNQFAYLWTREFTSFINRVQPLDAGHPLAGVGATALANIFRYGEGSWAGLTPNPRLALVDFRRGMPGLVHRKVGQVVQLPMYFTDVVPFTVLPQEVLDARARFAQDTGFLALGPGEALAVELIDQSKPETMPLYTAFENDGDGKVRAECGVHHLGLSYHVTPTKVTDLHVNEAQLVLEQTRAALLYSAADGFTWRAQRLQSTIEALEAHLPSAPPERTESGAAIERWFVEDGSTSKMFALMKKADGWVDYPTSSDAWYYGIWVSPLKRQVLSYCEGDVTRVTCDSDAQFMAELALMASFHGTRRSPCGKAFDTDGTTYFFDHLSFLQETPRVVLLTAGSRSEAPLMGCFDYTHEVLKGLDDGQTVEVPREVFHLDLLHPAAFKPYTVTATGTANVDVVRFSVKTGDGIYEVTAPLLLAYQA